MRLVSRRGVRTPFISAALVAVSACVLFVTTGTASALVQDAITVDVQSSVQSSVPLGNGNCQWTVVSNVTVYNVTNPVTTITYSNTWPTVSYTGPGISGVVPGSAITINNNGGLQNGDTLAGPVFNSAAYNGYSVSFVLPCAATDGDLQVHILTAGGSNTSGDAPFLANGSAVPLAPVAGVLTATVLTGSLLLVRRRRRVPATAMM